LKELDEKEVKKPKSFFFFFFCFDIHSNSASVFGREHCFVSGESSLSICASTLFSQI
jgi:hypothetical protein